MKRYLIALVVTLASVQAAQAMDHRSQWGVGGGLGGTFAAPWAQKEFESRVSGNVPAVSLWTRYIPGTPEVGVQLGYDFFRFGKMKTTTSALTVEFISRQNPWGWFHPFYGFGVGYGWTKNFYATSDWDTIIYKLTAGIEFELNERTDVGFYLNHFTVFKNDAIEANMHAITPVVTINYYFGTPAPMPAPPTTTPAATGAPAAPTPAPAPAVSKPAEPESSESAPLKKPAKPAKKPAPKKKKKNG